MRELYLARAKSRSSDILIWIIIANAIERLAVIIDPDLYIATAAGIKCYRLDTARMLLLQFIKLDGVGPDQANCMPIPLLLSSSFWIAGERFPVMIRSLVGGIVPNRI